MDSVQLEFPAVIYHLCISSLPTSGFQFLCIHYSFTSPSSFLNSPPFFFFSFSIEEVLSCSLDSFGVESISIYSVPFELNPHRIQPHLVFTLAFYCSFLVYDVLYPFLVKNFILIFLMMQSCLYQTSVISLMPNFLFQQSIELLFLFGHLLVCFSRHA